LSCRSTDGWYGKRLPGQRRSVRVADERCFRLNADQDRVGVIKPRSDESTDDGFRHVLSEGRANMTHSPDMVECRLGDCVDMVVKCHVFVQRYRQYFDVVCQ